MIPLCKNLFQQLESWTLYSNQVQDVCFLGHMYSEIEKILKDT